MSFASSHGLSTHPPGLYPNQGGNGNSVPCRFFKNGTCGYGNACPFSHSKASGDFAVTNSNNICKYYSKGTCRFGTACALSHAGPKPLVRATTYAPPSYPAGTFFNTEIRAYDDDTDSLDLKELLEELDHLSESTTLPASAQPNLCEDVFPQGVKEPSLEAPSKTAGKDMRIARLWEPVEIPPHPVPAGNVCHSQSVTSLSGGSALESAFSPGSGAEFLRQSRRLSIPSTGNVFSRLPAAGGRLPSSSPESASVSGRASTFFPSLCASDEEFSEDTSFSMQPTASAAGDVSVDTQFSLDMEQPAAPPSWPTASGSARLLLPNANGRRSLCSYSNGSLSATKAAGLQPSSSMPLLPFKLDSVRQDSGLDLGIIYPATTLGNSFAPLQQNQMMQYMAQTPQSRPVPYFPNVNSGGSNASKSSSSAGSSAGPNSNFSRRASISNPNALCPFAINGTCRFNQSCRYVHGLPCPNCKRNILHPDPAIRAQESMPHVVHCKSNMLAAQKRNQMQIQLYIQLCQNQLAAGDGSGSVAAMQANPTVLYEQLECGLCYEKIVFKKDGRFGILNCDHVFCLSCIRQWRSNFYMDNQVTRSCPVCRVVTHFVTPALKWPLFQAEKDALITEYKLKISQVPCKYYNYGSSICPFGASCFYSHEIPPNLVISSAPLLNSQQVCNSGRVL